MSALTSLFSNGPIFFGAFGIALLGSGHCVGMCGGLASTVAKKKTPMYHLGRGASYAIIGISAGAAGSGIFKILDASPIALLGISISFFVILFLQAVLVWRGALDSSGAMRFQRKAFQGLIAPAMSRYSKSSNGFMFGMSSALVPCGWILTFAWSAAATGSPFRGLILFMALWMGSLPALLAASSFISQLRKTFSGSLGRRLTAALILVLSLGSLWNRVHSLDSSVMGGSHRPDLYCLPKK